MFEDMTPEKIRGRILGRLKTDLQTREGSFTNDVIAAASVETSELYHSLDALLPSFYVDETSGQFIDRQAGIVGIGRKLGTRASCVITFTGSSGFFRLYDETAMGNSYISGGEYVLLGTDTGKLTYKAPVCSERIALNSYEKRGCYVRLDCDCGAYGQPAELPQEYQGGYEQRQYIELPLLYYKGYRAKECGGGILPVVCGEPADNCPT